MIILFECASNLPFYYRKLAGNISDVKTVKNLLADLDFFEYKKIKLVLDRGFYSEENTNGLYQNHIKFLIGVKMSLKYVKKELDNARTSIQNWSNFNPQYNLYTSSSPPLEVDGKFGGLTERAIRGAQKELGIPQNGIFNTQTLYQLEMATMAQQTSVQTPTLLNSGQWILKNTGMLLGKCKSMLFLQLQARKLCKE